MKQQAVSKRDRFVFGQRVIASALLSSREIVQSKRVRCNQTVIARVPKCWVTKVLWMVENRKAHDIAINRPPIVHPLRGLAPNLFAFDTLAVNRLAKHFLDSLFRGRGKS